MLNIFNTYTKMLWLKQFLRNKRSHAPYDITLTPLSTGVAATTVTKEPVGDEPPLVRDTTVEHPSKYPLPKTESTATKIDPKFRRLH